MPFVDLSQKKNEEKAEQVQAAPSDIKPAEQKTSTEQLSDKTLETAQVSQQKVPVMRETVKKESSGIEENGFIKKQGPPLNPEIQQKQQKQETSRHNDFTLAPDESLPPIDQMQKQNQINAQNNVGSNVSANNSIPGAGELTAQNSPKTTSLQTYLDITASRGASDLHFSVGYPPMIRVDGKLKRVTSEPLLEKDAERLLVTILNDKDKVILKDNREVDLSIQSDNGARFRVNIFFQRGKLAAAFRLIPSKIKSIDELYLPRILYDLLDIPHGLVLVTGPTGSGKSTTLAAMLNQINLTTDKHILTFEDPIEYIYPAAKALVDQREIGRDAKSFESALRGALRQDPDVVLVGEMRDYETIANTITVAETGHLVFATLHTNSAAETIDRIIDVFPEHAKDQVRTQLSSVLVGVISQRLVPIVQGGRRAACEILLATSAVKNSIREAKTYQLDNIIQTSADIGMFPLEKSLADLIKRGMVTIETAKEFTNKPELLSDLLK